MIPPTVSYSYHLEYSTSEWPPCLKENLTQPYGLETHGPGSLLAGGGWRLTATLALFKKKNEIQQINIHIIDKSYI